MKIQRGLFPPDTRPVALTIGNFDGVHLGHQALLKELLAEGKARGLPTAVVIFEPHPREFFMPQQAPVRLTSLREKLELFSALGIDRVHVCRFNARFAQLSAADFINLLHDKLFARFVLIGDDFSVRQRARRRFCADGKDRFAARLCGAGGTYRGA